MWVPLFVLTLAFTGAASRLSLFSKINNLFAEASEIHGIDQPLCRDCYKKTSKMLNSRIDTFREEAQAYRNALRETKEESEQEGLVDRVADEEEVRKKRERRPMC